MYTGRAGTADLAAVLAGLFLLFVGSQGVVGGLGMFDAPFRFLRAVTGAVLVFFLPGLLLLQLFDVRTESFGVFVMYAVGSSLASVTLLGVVANFLLSAVGVGSPVSFGPLAVVLAVYLLALLLAVEYVNGSSIGFPPPAMVNPVPVLVAASLLGLAVLAAYGMRLVGSNLGMYAFVLAVVAVVLVTATRYVPPRHYPLFAFSVALATLFHRHLLTGQVVGADVQALYGVSNLILETGQWELTASTTSAIPGVTLTPAVVAALTGVRTATVFTVFHSVLFALVPLGIYYLSRDLFDPDIALYGALFFVFYHVSFYFTPGKQLVSELFLILILLGILQDRFDGVSGGGALAVLSAGLVLTHYAVTYVFASALLAAALGLFVLRATVDEFDGRLSIAYPAVLLVAATGWYWIGSSELFAVLASLPPTVLDQIAVVLGFGAVEGTGAAYVQEQSALLERVRLAVYGVSLALTAVGLGWLTLTTGRRVADGDSPDFAGYVALALPLFFYLALSYVLVFNIWADRIYQMVLVVLAPFLPLGYVLVRDRVGSLSPVGLRDPGPGLSGVAVLLAVLFVLNSGFAFALVGNADTSTFDEGANDLAFTDEEHEGVSWLLAHENITRTEYRSSESFLDVENPDAVRVYVDPRSYQLFRGAMPPAHHNVELLHLKNRWQPEFEPDRLSGGYVFVRKRSIGSADGEPVPPTTLTDGEMATIRAAGSVAFENDAVVIVDLSEDVPADSER